MPNLRQKSAQSAKIPAFSMVELVFVIVILGILAAVAIPRFSLTRTDAQVVAIESDLNGAASTLQREVFSQNIDGSAIDGEFILNISGLSRARWVAQGNGIKPAKNGVLDEANNCIRFEYENGALVYEVTQKADSPLCQKLHQRNTPKTIPLISSDAIF